MDTLHAFAPEIQPDLDLDNLVSEDDRAWWSQVTGRSARWADLLVDSVADDYGEPIGEHDDDDVVIDKYIGNRGYAVDPPDEWFAFGGYPT
jgi:hypothetical protein